jgi:hypothetical protein
VLDGGAYRHVDTAQQQLTLEQCPVERALPEHLIA